ncbi:cytidylate kinase family protein [Candidatus Uhrbacteria bacterium]|nr:cytidylate kinase family protein [Candidatus Uhrbacteria bacterium]
MKYNGILFSGLPGSGKSTAVRQLAPLLDWPTFSLGDLWREQWQKLYPNQELSFEEYYRATTFEENRAMDARARDILAQGTIVSDMRHGIIAEGLPMILRVFISADMNVRAERALQTNKYKGKTLEEVRDLLSQREQTEVATAKTLYGDAYDFRDASGYHLTLNSGLLTVDEKIQSVIHFFK